MRKAATLTGCFLVLAFGAFATLVAGNDQKSTDVCFVENFDFVSVDATSQSIILGESDSDAHKIINQVASILLQEIGGVEVFRRPNPNVEWDLIKEGTELHAHLFVRPYDIAEKSSYIYDTFWVEDAGPLGVHGYSGLFMPTYIFDQLQNLELNQQIGRLDYEFLMKPEVVSLFRGRIQNMPSSAKSSKWYSQFIFNVLGNEYVIDSVDTWAESITRINVALDNNRPILFFMEYPDPLFSRYNLTRIKLPGFTDECYEKSRQGGTDCDFPQVHIHKVIWPGLEEQNPMSHKFFEEFALTDMDMEKLVGSFIETGSHFDAACKWARSNPKKWRLFFVDTPNPIPSSQMFSVSRVIKIACLMCVVFLIFRFHTSIFQTLGIGSQTGALTFWYFFNRIVPPKSSLNVTIQVWALTSWYWWRRITGQSRDIPIDYTSSRTPPGSRSISRKSSTSSMSTAPNRGSRTFSGGVDAEHKTEYSPRPASMSISASTPLPRKSTDSNSPATANADLRHRLLSGGVQ